MTVIGVTGPSGAGKSLFCSYLEELGCLHLDCDKIYHDLVDSPSECTRALEAEVGASVIKPDGSLDRIALGAIALKIGEHTDMTDRADECELGYWLGKPFWGRGYMPEAAAELIRYGFEDLGMRAIWCGYYEGNLKSKRVQEKLGFVYRYTHPAVPVPLMGETRVGITNRLTKEEWLAQKKV